VRLLADVDLLAYGESVNPHGTLYGHGLPRCAHGSSDRARDPYVLCGSENPARDCAGDRDHAAGGGDIAVDATCHCYGLTGGIQIIGQPGGGGDSLPVLEDESPRR
jgi:hypothetical protein